MPRRLPISGRPAHPEPLPAFALGHGIWSRGKTFLELVEAAGPVRTALDAFFAAVRIPAAVERFFMAFPRQARILALGNLQEPESQINLAQAERLFSLGQHLWMRTFPVAEHEDLVRRFASPAWPLLVFFADDRREFARWGPRPRALQELEEADPGEAAARRLAFYEGDQGQSLAQDLACILASYAGLAAP